MRISARRVFYDDVSFTKGLTHGTRLILSSISPAARSRYDGVWAELQAELLNEKSPEEIAGHTDLSRAHVILVEATCFDSAAAALLRSLRAAAPEIPVVVLLNKPSAGDEARFSRAGAYSCLPSTSIPEELYTVLLSAITETSRIHETRMAPPSEKWRRHLVGCSEPIAQVTEIIRLIASRRSTVLISGETGTGKEMAARAIHMASDRCNARFVAVNCSAIPENLVEAELFGHVKGAFTGAVSSRAGRFEQADGGTLFLDEIGDLPFELQAKLLRVLQEREVQRLGSSETIKINVRIIAASNADLLAMVAEGRFREDLYYRLNVVPIRMPALRERPSDIPLLAEHFVEKVCTSEGLPLKRLSSDAIDRLCAYQWPGNVRQLENIIEHAVVMSGEQSSIFGSRLSLPERSQPEKVTPIAPVPHNIPDEGLDFEDALRQFGHSIITQALNKARGNKTRAADLLRLPRTTLIHKIRIMEPQFGAAVA